MPPTRPRSRSRRVPRARLPLRTRIPRSALPYWLVVLLLAGVTAGTVDAVLRRAADAEARYGTTAPVLVATGGMAAGDPVDAASTEVRRWPSALVPDGALRARPDGERVAVAAIADGEAVVASRVSGQAAAGVAGLLAPGTRAVVVPLEVAGLPVAVGDLVDVLTTGEDSGPNGDLPDADSDDGDRDDGRGVAVASDALVVAVAEESIVVGVGDEASLELAAALGRGPVVVALSAPGG